MDAGPRSSRLDACRTASPAFTTRLLSTIMMPILEQRLSYTLRTRDSFAASLLGCMQTVWLLLLGPANVLAWSGTAACAHAICDIEEGWYQGEPAGCLQDSRQQECVLESIDFHQVSAFTTHAS